MKGATTGTNGEACRCQPRAPLWSHEIGGITWFRLPWINPADLPVARTIRLQSDSNAHDRPWRVAVEQGFFAEEGLDVVYHEDNPKGAEGRVKDFTHRWKEKQLQQGALE